MPDMIRKEPQETEPPLEEPPPCKKWLEGQGKSHATGFISSLYSAIRSAFCRFDHRHFGAANVNVCTIFSGDRTLESPSIAHCNRQYESMANNWATVRFVRYW